MNEEIAIALAAVGFLGSLCSILAYAEYRFDKFRLSKRRKKMMERE